MKYNDRVQRWNEAMRATRSDADDGEGHWVTTKEGNHMFINGEGEPTKGNPHVLAAAKGEVASSTSKKTFRSKSHAIESLSTAEKAVNGTGERLEKKRSELKTAKAGDKEKIQEEIGRMEKQYKEESSRLYDLMTSANKEYGVTSKDLPKSKGRPTEWKVEKAETAEGSRKAESIKAESRMTGETITLGSLKERAKKGLSAKEKNDLMQDAMDLAVENPLNYFDVKAALGRAGLDDQFEWEMGPANFNGFEELIKPAFDKKKSELKSKIPSPSKNKSSSAVINGQKIIFTNARNAEYPAHSRQQRFIDIRIEDPETGEKIGSYAANDYESAMEHVYRIAGLRTK